MTYEFFRLLVLTRAVSWAASRRALPRYFDTSPTAELLTMPPLRWR